MSVGSCHNPYEGDDPNDSKQAVCPHCGGFNGPEPCPFCQNGKWATYLCSWNHFYLSYHKAAISDSNKALYKVGHSNALYEVTRFLMGFDYNYTVLVGNKCHPLHVVSETEYVGQMTKELK